MRRILALFAALLLLCSCGGETTATTTEYDLHGGISSLDPQFAQGAGQTAAANLFLGLVYVGQDNVLYPMCAENWDVQSGGTRYVFHLRDDMTWSDGTKVTADDFLFAFERMFSPDSPSPYAQTYSAIKNADAVLAGEAQMSSLGVSASDESTLVITLSHADNTFLYLLAQTPAMPCNRTFFAAQKGRYGLDADSILTNGAFSVSSWTSSALRLVKNESAPVQTSVSQLTLNLNVTTDSATERFLAGTTAACLLDNPADAENAQHVDAFYDRTWSLILNPAADTLADREVRAAILGAVSSETLTKAVVENSLTPEGIVSRSFAIGDFTYRDIGTAKCPAYPGDPRSALQAAFERLGVTSYPSLTLLLCDEEPGIGYGGAMQRDWSDSLSLYINVETVPYETLLSRVASGDFDLALAPLGANGDKTGGLLTAVNLLGEDYSGMSDALTEGLSRSSAKSTAAALYSVEQTILDECFAMPVCDTERVFAQNTEQSDIRYSISTGVTYFFAAQQ